MMAQGEFQAYNIARNARPSGATDRFRSLRKPLAELGLE